MTDEFQVVSNPQEEKSVVTYTCTSYVKKKELEYIKSLVNFTLKKFFTPQKIKQLDIEICFKKDLFTKYKQYGNCMWEDQRHRPSVFSIEVEPNQSLKLLLNTVAHELVHIKQWAKGEFVELDRASRAKKGYVFRYQGRNYDDSKVDYWDMPWEIEAHGRAIGLVVQWCRENKYVAKDFVVDG